MDTTKRLVTTITVPKVDVLKLREQKELLIHMAWNTEGGIHGGRRLGELVNLLETMINIAEHGPMRML